MKKKILLVDDDTAVRESLARLLRGENFSVLAAANGQDALRIANQTRVDLVLLDLNLPVKNGWETFESLSCGHPALPVIIITARSNQLFPAMASGAGALMEKPLDFPKLLQTIGELLAEPEQTRRARMAGKSAGFHYLPAQPAAQSESM